MRRYYINKLCRIYVEKITKLVKPPAVMYTDTVYKNSSFVIWGSLGMGIADVISLLGGIALFLYGMAVMGDNLKKVAGSKLEIVL